MSAPRPEDIEDILLHHFPWKRWTDQFAAALRPVAISKGNPQLYDNIIQDHPDAAKLEAMRASLLSMPAPEVARLAKAARAVRAASEAAAQAQREADARAAAQAKEAKRFYNQPGAAADVALWAKADTWTLDDAVALLLGKDPRIVTPDALRHELQTGTGLMQLGKPPARSAFHDQYDRLRLLLERSEHLTGSRLKPADVLAWAQRTGAAPVPAALAAALSPPVEAANASQEPQAAGATGVANGAPEAKPPRKLKWSEDEKAALRAYKKAHGTKAAAQKYRITETRVRALIKTEPPTSGGVLLQNAWGGKKR